MKKRIQKIINDCVSIINTEEKKPIADVADDYVALLRLERARKDLRDAEIRLMDADCRDDFVVIGSRIGSAVKRILEVISI